MVLSVLENIEYRLCESGEDLEAIYRLRYDSYLNAGMVGEDAARMVTDRYDELPNSYRFGVFYEGNLVSTIRLHYVNSAFPVSPSSEVFGDILEPRIAAGETFVDPSRFAAEREWARTLRVLPYITLRLAVVACKHFNPTFCLTAVKEEHGAFYHRIFRSTPATDARDYPGLTVPVLLLESRCSENMEDTIRRFPFFRSTAFERRLLFERPKRGEPAPLTILPTAKYLRDAA
ncbi:N-acyl amino acid synthase FeeM domain-containing protein [Chelativorans intermedius]|uniref:Acyl-homoserine-lactone synthase n=1 Tax=Chelativorans intermedius TaxID=515947 RepID=A0ABV6D436_9HYPH|nr:acyl-homoserine-lactone synthase [Chelativorans intermedius]MCT8997693.1 hypothetical protein [Chelativorans intermedius]